MGSNPAAPTIKIREQVRAAAAAMPAGSLIERRNRALVVFAMLTGVRDRVIYIERGYKQLRPLFLLMSLILGACTLTSQAHADDCGGTPAAAIVKLPEPLVKWGALVCTREGYVISNGQDWLWTYPGAFAPVILSSQMGQKDLAALGARSYFTRIEMTKVDGEEFQLAYSTFHEGFAPDPEQPTGYRLDLASVSGRTLKLYFFDYGVRVWGIRCPDKCDRNTRFMLLNLNKSPEPQK